MSNLRNLSRMTFFVLTFFLMLLISCSKDDKVMTDTNQPPSKPQISAVSGTPPHGSNGQTITPVLRWSCSDPDGDKLTYDVHLGKTINPSVVSGSQAQTSYSPDTLQYSTKYYWRIVATDESNASSSSDTWEFTTKAATTESVTSPLKPVGPDSGEVSEVLNFSTGNSTSNLGHSLQYRFDWGDGNYSNWSSSATSSHQYSTVGRFYVYAEVRCAIHTSITNSSTWKEVDISTLVHAVNRPNRPSGPESGFINQTYSYSTGGSSCTRGHAVQYRFAWGTGDPSQWSSSSGIQHSWSSTGSFYVQAQGRCAVDTSVLSEWSQFGLLVRIDEPETITAPGYMCGSAQVNVGVQGSWAICNESVSNLGHVLGYRVDWGDGSFSNWTLPSETFYHAFSNRGIYNVRAQARCTIHSSVISLWGPSIPVEVGSSSSTVILQAVQDADVAEFIPDNNNGDNYWLSVGRIFDSYYYSYIQFDLNAIPQGSTIDKAELILKRNSTDGTFEMIVRTVGEGWSENAITWNNAAISVTFPFSIVNPTLGGDSVVIDVKELVEEWVSGNRANNGFSLSPNPTVIPDGNAVVFGSRNNNNSSLRPVLKITFR